MKLFGKIGDNPLNEHNTCPTCGCKTIHKQENSKYNQITDGMFCEKCQKWVIVTSYSKLSLDKTRYKLTFSLQDASKRARHEILTMCSGNLTQQQLNKENISITDNAESIQGIIQRLKGFDVAYEVTPPFPYEVESWDGFMDRDFLEELAKNNPGLDIDGVLREQMEDIKKYGD